MKVKELKVGEAYAYHAASPSQYYSTPGCWEHNFNWQCVVLLDTQYWYKYTPASGTKYQLAKGRRAQGNYIDPITRKTERWAYGRKMDYVEDCGIPAMIRREVPGAPDRWDWIMVSPQHLHATWADYDVVAAPAREVRQQQIAEEARKRQEKIDAEAALQALIQNVGVISGFDGVPAFDLRDRQCVSVRLDSITFNGPLAVDWIVKLLTTIPEMIETYKDMLYELEDE